MSNNITIRKALITDAPIIAGFNSAMALETEGKSLKEEKIKAGVENLFRHPEYGFYIVAEAENRVIGCLLITYEWSDWRNGLVWWIQSVYIHPDFRRQGIYRKMYAFIKNLASSKTNVCGFRLYVEKENRVAQNTYKNLGMVETVYNMYEEMLG
ncbi:GNAT family N-acetyltransferase [bacterium]|nr:GNAT family N-acetyltransferase [bacterium]MBU1064130.1 GNAT family N-acetyltransferase [bacterium]MBU1634890.1 GNAT family N-acetyltransferase [bacterium]MBU1872667.1 GNAT family N-acetyltransferase [bacterium]